jgi:Tfp pilus assembly protein PilX
MKAGKFNGRRITPPRQQRGVVMFIALIILVAMTLAGIGMLRSIDTGGVIAGNMAFKQATINASDMGSIAGFNALVSVANSTNPADKAILNSDGNNTAPCATYAINATAASCATAGSNINLPGYFATPINPCEVTGKTTGTDPITGSPCSPTQNQWWSIPANWNNAVTLPPVTDPSNGSTIATVSYIIHRMCLQSSSTPGQAGAPNVPGSPNSSNQLCQTYVAPASGCTKTSPPLPCTSTSIFYRITSRSLGQRGSATYTQTLVKIGA